MKPLAKSPPASLQYAPNSYYDREEDAHQDQVLGEQHRQTAAQDRPLEQSEVNERLRSNLLPAELQTVRPSSAVSFPLQLEGWVKRKVFAPVEVKVTLNRLRGGHVHI